MTIRPAPIELANLAEVMRPGWDRRQFEGALGAAAAAGWPWLRIFNTAMSLMGTENASPRDLTAAVQHPFSRRQERSVAANDEFREKRAQLGRPGGAA
jgi:hypothetical protein